jgi:uncharacterized protein with von Willebrand factor type A (vWA) domain
MQVYFLVDRSGSMADRWDETLGSINGFVENLSKNNIGKTKITVSLFDSIERFNIIRNKQPLHEWKALNNNDASPRGGTPLLDAIGELDKVITSKGPKQAMIIILTDGQENSSRLVVKEQAKAIIDKWNKKNYEVIFLGADFNAFGEAGAVGVSFGKTLNMSSGNYGATADFTEEERKAASGA